MVTFYQTTFLIYFFLMNGGGGGVVKAVYLDVVILSTVLVLLWLLCSQTKDYNIDICCFFFKCSIKDEEEKLDVLETEKYVQEKRDVLYADFYSILACTSSTIPASFHQSLSSP